MTKILLFLLFLAPTIQYRLELGPTSISSAEIMTLLVILVLLIPQISRRKIVILREPSILFFVIISFWALLIRPWAVNWQSGLSDVRDWFIPLLGFIVLITTVRRGWRKWIILFFFVAVILALLGIYQHLTDSFRPFISETAAIKRGFGITADGSDLEIASFATGFFAHPNQFAFFLFPALLIGIGWIMHSRKFWFVKIALLMLVGLALFWTFAKASLIVMVAAMGLLTTLILIKSTKLLSIILITGVFLGPLLLLAVMKIVPAAYLTTLWWRIGLWEIALQAIAENPNILLLGNGMDAFGQLAYYDQPHNAYVYMLLQYGVVGLAWLLLLLGSIWHQGWRLKKSKYFLQEPLLAALWVALLGFFAIDLVESNLIGIESRMLFLLILACFVGLSRETVLGRQIPNKNEKYLC